MTRINWQDHNVSWGNQSSDRQDKYLQHLRQDVLGRAFTTKDLHNAYEHAGVSRPPKLLPTEFTKTQASRMIDWLKHLKLQSKVDALVDPMAPSADDPCLYCTFGCEYCET